MTDPARADYVITLTAGVTATASLWPVDDLRWSCSLTDPTGVECWQGGPWANRDRALSAVCLETEIRWGCILKCEPKERVDEVSRLRARVAELETIVRAVAAIDDMMELIGGCQFCEPVSYDDLGGDSEHEDGCPWILARKALGLG